MLRVNITKYLDIHTNDGVVLHDEEVFLLLNLARLRVVEEVL
jgi:hypothetical protein